MKKILYSVARDHTGELIRAVDAEKEGQYFCGFCSDLFVLKKSGKTGPRTKRPHFAHKTLTPNCTPESALHFEFKNLLYRAIEARLTDGRETRLSWKCRYCYGNHSGNLLKTARNVMLEHSLENCRPDLVLTDKNGSIVAAIEVVVTHAPEDNVREYYRKNKIVLIELHLKSEADLDHVVSKLNEADHVQLCVDRNRCSVCGHFQQPIKMRIFEAPCYRCKAKMKVPFIEGDEFRGSHVGSDEFSPNERSLAAEHGVLIEWQYSRTVNTKYWATTCKRCHSFIGRNLLFTGYIIHANDGDFMNDLPLGHLCTFCAQENNLI